MFKNNLTQKLVALCTVILFSVSATDAQNTIIWGAGSSDTRIDSIGKFAIASGGTLADLGWINYTSDTCSISEWAWSPDGASQGPYATPNYVISSPSAADGLALYDSDFFDSQGCSAQEASLTSPAIDLTGYADSSVAIQFYAGLRNFQSDSNLIQFSTDGGASWISFDVISKLGGTSANQDTLTFRITSALAGATNLTDCRVRLYFKGNSYYFGVDDISIMTVLPLPPYDLAFVASSGPTYGDLQHHINVGNYRSIPLSQVAVNQFYFGARVGNLGDNNILPSENAKFLLNIETNGNSVYRDTIEIDTAYVGVVDSLYAKDIDDISWIQGTGTYNVTYTLVMDSLESDLTNNIIEQTFYITDNYYSKVNRNPTTGGPTGRYFWSGGVDPTDLSWEWGSMFYFPTGTTSATDSIILDSVSFMYRVPSPNPGDQKFSVKVYKFTDVNNDGSIEEDGSELTIVGVGIHDATNLNPRTVHTPKVKIKNLSGQSLSVNADDIYVITIAQGLNTGINYPLLFEDEFYIMSQFNAPLAAPAWTSITKKETSQETTWKGIGVFFSNIAGMGVPSIGVYVNKETSVAISNVEQNDFEAEVFPNPTEDNINVRIALEEPTNVKYILTAINGSVIDIVYSKNVAQEVRTFDTTKLAAGIYTLSIITENGKVVNRRVVKK